VSVHSRGAVPGDYDLFARLVLELATGDPVPEAGRWQETLMPTTLFFEEEGQVVAYAWATTLADVGYVRHVVVDPAHRGHGHGRVVMDTLAEHFRRAGCTRWVLNVKPDNLPAIRLYRSVGMRDVYLSTALRLEWSVVDRLPRPARAVTGRPADPAEDDALEAAFRLPKSTLATSRSYAGRVIVRLVDPAAADEARVGVASFDVEFPGAFPFRVADPTLGRSLLEAMRPHALPKHSNVGVVVEDDAALARLLIEHGAEVRLEIVHYEGEL
jgi:GNAT superfamily N-acetyltransferase